MVNVAALSLMAAKTGAKSSSRSNGRVTVGPPLRGLKHADAATQVSYGVGV
ncbi:hypothetical protein SAMN04487914_101167 [Arthrobacter sp. ok909]|nr:hypothetical protein SAMN04487914_101167 [Arthrobacter sp. ok909]